MRAVNIGALVLTKMAERFKRDGQRLFWLSQFEVEDEAALRRVVDLLEERKLVEWRLGFHCPECNGEWGGHPKNAPSRCRRCGFDLAKYVEEEDETLFVSDKFALLPEVKSLTLKASRKSRSKKSSSTTPAD